MTQTVEFVNKDKNGIGLNFPVLLVQVILFAVNIEDNCIDMKNIGPDTERRNVMLSISLQNDRIIISQDLI
jgi:hypothetical protein